MTWTEKAACSSPLGCLSRSLQLYLIPSLLLSKARAIAAQRPPEETFRLLKGDEGNWTQAFPHGLKRFWSEFEKLQNSEQAFFCIPP